MKAPGTFLTAEWRHLVMLNYAVDPALLAGRVPDGTEIDTWNGACYISMVGFNFLRTRVKGLPIPFHQDFEEINLRFYVRHKAAEGWRRGVVFVKEIVPRPAIALVARTLYNENYVALPTRHTCTQQDGIDVRYEWRFQGRWNSISAAGRGTPAVPAADSEARFISEHYWGYCAQRGGGTKEYRVEHPSWQVWTATQAELDVDAATLYGPEFASALTGAPSSAFIADGSPVSVSDGIKITTARPAGVDRAIGKDAAR